MSILSQDHVLRNKDELLLIRDKSINMYEMSKTIGVTRKTLRHYLLMHNISRPTPVIPNTILRQDKNWFLKRIAENATKRDLQKELQCGQFALESLLKQHRIKWPRTKAYRLDEAIKDSVLYALDKSKYALDIQYKKHPPIYRDNRTSNLFIYEERGKKPTRRFIKKGPKCLACNRRRLFCTERAHIKKRLNREQFCKECRQDILVQIEPTVLPKDTEVTVDRSWKNGPYQRKDQPAVIGYLCKHPSTVGIIFREVKLTKCLICNRDILIKKTRVLYACQQHLATIRTISAPLSEEKRMYTWYQKRHIAINEVMSQLEKVLTPTATGSRVISLPSVSAESERLRIMEYFPNAKQIDWYELDKKKYAIIETMAIQSNMIAGNRRTFKAIHANVFKAVVNKDLLFASLDLTQIMRPELFRSISKLLLKGVPQKGTAGFLINVNSRNALGITKEKSDQMWDAYLIHLNNELGLSTRAVVNRLSYPTKGNSPGNYMYLYGAVVERKVT